MTPLDTLLKNVNTPTGLRVFATLPNANFLDLKKFASFRLKPDVPLFILYKYRNPLRGAELHVDASKSADLTLGKMHYLYSGAILFGYLFEFPVLPFRIYDNFCSVNAVEFDANDIKDVQPVVINQHVTVYGCSDISVVMIANAVQYIDVKR